MACEPGRVSELASKSGLVERVEEALTGRGVRLVLRESMPLAGLPPEVLDSLSECEVVELVYPDGRVVYVSRRWLERVAGGGAPRGESEGPRGSG